MAKKMADYLTTVLEDVEGKWVTNSFTKDRRIALYGVSIAITQLGNKVTIDPVIPCAFPLAKLVRKYPKASEFKFDRKKRKWRLA